MTTEDKKPAPLGVNVTGYLAMLDMAMEADNQGDEAAMFEMMAQADELRGNVDERAEAMAMARRHLLGEIARLEEIVAPTLKTIASLKSRVNSIEAYARWALRPLADKDGKVKAGSNVAGVAFNFAVKDAKVFIDESRLSKKALDLWNIKWTPARAEIKKRLKAGERIEGAKLETGERLGWR